MLFYMVSVSADEFEATAIKGERTFLKYCAGCHGFEGKARYQHAPSFSLGERLQKDDRELLQSVLNGKNNMPPWRDKLPVQDLRNAIAYLRLMHQRYEKGEAPLQHELPGSYYLFKPVGEQNMQWVTEDGKK
jgi:mono/diheme cytochrome c family protein